MSAASAAPSAKSSANRHVTTGSAVQSGRETVESIVVAFILAFLFRAFVAEAFVIPTGSMAPTLMGAHKDVVCEYCGEAYQASASEEFDSSTGQLVGRVTLASTCSTCRGLNAYDFVQNPNAVSFDGDRILVSKFDYVLSQPKRWDVFVFKYPDEARMNYIKRLIGLPGEKLQIQDGDIYAQSTGQLEIARKPPHKVRAMRQIVSDTDHRGGILVEKGWPSLWQPWTSQASPTGAANGWELEHTPEVWSAKLASSTDRQWLRYYHKVVDGVTWEGIRQGGDLPPVSPTSSQLVTDFLAYNSSFYVESGLVYTDRSNDKLQEGISAERRAYDFVAERGRGGLSAHELNGGFHWVGDLIGEFDMEVQSSSGKLLLDLVEFGIHYECSIDVATGEASLTAKGQDLPQPVFVGEVLKGQTGVKGPGRYRLEYANVDDQITLWVDGSVVSFDGSSAFDSKRVRTAKDRRPYWTEADPLDAAPVGIGGEQLEMTVRRAQVFRDLYYIAPQIMRRGTPYCDYNLDHGSAILASIPAPEERRQLSDQEAILKVYSHPQWWSQTNLFNLRGRLNFELEADQFFPMGDNSAASSDARAWSGHHFVEQKFLLGKALLVFWPHTWNTPVPYTPNIARMGRIQ
ncbi:signal peptidase I [Aureliella helgolandensis]|nr:signal peptidase I [Aureliella helgolandensis]